MYLICRFIRKGIYIFHKIYVYEKIIVIWHESLKGDRFLGFPRILAYN